MLQKSIRSLICITADRISYRIGPASWNRGSYSRSGRNRFLRAIMQTGPEILLQQNLPEAVVVWRTCPPPQTATQRGGRSATKLLSVSPPLPIRDRQNGDASRLR